ncbi:LpqN/LpqT family lipoprotein, partial [Mycobacterium asiaticum]|uniref:LpqN/LpqT family lipoprotein n=1 Tax=Mycobacterium asiaticum TaxID=1790 RepID=UPI0015616DF3
MFQIARTWRTVAGGMAAGVVGLVLVAGGTASAEPMIPQPSIPGPVPMQPATPPGQNSTVFPGSANSNRFAPAPAQAPALAPLQAPAQVQPPAAVAAPVPAAGPATAPAPAAALPAAGPATALAPAAALPAAGPGTAPAPAAAPTPPAAIPAVTGTLREYLESKGVKLEAQRPLNFKALDITLPMPARWTQVPDPNVPDAFVVIA